MTNDLGLNTFTKPDSVVVYQPSKTNAVVDVNNKSLKKVSVPSDTKLTIHLICIAYLNSVACKKLTHLHRKNIVLSIELLFRFIKQKGYQTDGDVPTTLFEKFTTYLNKHTGKQGYSVRDTLNKAKAPFEWALRNPELSEVKQFDTTSFRAFLVYIPHIPKGKHEKKPPLSAIFPNCPYSDTQLIKSLRLISCWTLLEYERHRNLLLEHSEIQSLVTTLSKRDITQPPLDYGTWAGKKGQVELEAECRQLYTTLTQKILEIGDDVLTERLLSSINMPFAFPLSDNEWDLIISKLITKTGLITKQYTYEKVCYNVQSEMSVSFRDLMAPSHVEVFAAQCFYASDRLQTSNLERLTISDISSNEQGTQTRHTKIRRVRRKNNFTPVYPPNGLISDSLEAYKNILVSCQTLIPEPERRLAFPYLTSHHLKVGDFGRAKNSTTLFYKLLITEGTRTQTELFKDVSQEDAEPILWIIRNIFERNAIVKEEELAYAAALHESKKKKSANKVIRASFVKTERISLNPTYIGESRVVMNSGGATWIRGEKKQPQFNDSFVESELSAHTAATNYNVYKDRTTSNEELQRRTSFAEQVAIQMEQDALKMNLLMQKADVIDLEKAKRLLRCATSISSLRQLFEASQANIGLTGEISHDGKTIFIENELTAALIIKRIENIEGQFPTLLLDDPELRNKALIALQNKVYLTEVFSKFSESTKQSGRNLADQLAFTFNDMV